MSAIKVEDINVDTLDEIANRWEEGRIRQLVSRSMIQLGVELNRARGEAVNAETRARIRAGKLYNQYKFSEKDIAELLDIELKEVRRWLKSYK